MIPRHSFLSWLFVLNRCPTKDRIIGWGLSTNGSCVLCNTADETRDHIFFSCAYSWNIWALLARRCGLSPERSWDLVMLQIGAIPRNSTKGILIRLCWQASMYWIWTERNARIHRRIFCSYDSIIRKLDRQIKDRILSLRESNPAASSRLMQQWLNWISACPPLMISELISTAWLFVFFSQWVAWAFWFLKIFQLCNLNGPWAHKTNLGLWHVRNVFLYFAFKYESLVTKKKKNHLTWIICMHAPSILFWGSWSL